jgi:iron complex outermembrane receptor protein
MRYEFNSGITLRSLSGYQDKKVHNLIDFDATSTINPPQSFDQRIRQRTWSEEINLLSSTAGRYDWVLGGYWQKDKINVDISAAGSTGPGGPDLYIFNPQSKTTTGWFGQLNFKLTAKWELQAGVRYSTFKTDGTGYVSLVLPAPVCAAIGLPSVVHGCQLAATDGSESDGRVTGKVALNYTPNEQNLLYAFVARGYKQGGFNSPTSLFSPETVMDYELGWKSELVGRHLATQLGGFYYDYHGFQFQTLNLNNGQTGVENLPKATIYGIEASLQAQIGGLRADLGAAYVHSNQPSPGPFVNQHLLPPGVQGPQCAPGQTANCFDYSPYLTTGSSGPNLYSPEWTANAGVQYAFTVANATTLTPRINYAYVSGQFTSLTYSKQTDYLPPHGLLSALVTLDVGEHWGAEVFGSNFTDKRYRSGSSGAFYLYGAPRQYGVHVRYRF